MLDYKVLNNCLRDMIFLKLSIEEIGFLNAMIHFEKIPRRIPLSELCKILYISRMTGVKITQNLRKKGFIVYVRHNMKKPAQEIEREK